MGKGDIKSKKGKLSNGTFGNSRKRKSDKKVEASKPEAPVKTTKKK
jgi:30S ribosomal protein S31